MITFGLLFQFVLSGIAIGSIYGLIAIGFIFIYRTSGIVNLAQGDFCMVGGFTAFLIQQTLHIPLFVSALISIVISFILGYLIDVVAIRRVQSLMNKGLITIGISFILASVLGLVFGVKYQKLNGIEGGFLLFNSAVIQHQSLLIVGILILVAFIMWIVLHKTKSGAVFRAVSDDTFASMLIGKNPARIRSIAFGVSGAVGALAGVLAGPIVGLSFDLGIQLSITGFIAAVLGGFGRPFGGLIAGVLIGIIQALSVGLISASLRDVITYLLLFIILLIRPSGFLGESKAGNSSL
jgi:branched-chain amino acid transport system permease protein